MSAVLGTVDLGADLTFSFLRTRRPRAIQRPFHPNLTAPRRLQAGESPLHSPDSRALVRTSAADCGGRRGALYSCFLHPFGDSVWDRIAESRGRGDPWSVKQEHIKQEVTEKTEK